MNQTESFIDFLNAYSESHAPVMVYREGEDFVEWQAQFQNVVEGLRGVVPERVALDVETVEVVEEADHYAYDKLGVGNHLGYVQHPDGHLLRWDLAAPFLERYL